MTGPFLIPDLSSWRRHCDDELQNIEMTRDEANHVAYRLHAGAAAVRATKVDG